MKTFNPKKLIISGWWVIALILIPTIVHAANVTVPQSTQYGQVLIGNSVGGNYTPVATSTLGISGSGTVTTLTAGTNITFSSGATCTTTCTINAIGSSGGSGNIATSSSEVSGRVPFWTSTAATPALLSGGSADFTYNDGTKVLCIGCTGSTVGTIGVGGPTGSGVITTNGGSLLTQAGSFDSYSTTYHSFYTNTNQLRLQILPNGIFASTSLTVAGTVTASSFIATSSTPSIFPVANITRLSNLTTNGLIRTSGGDGTLSVDSTLYSIFPFTPTTNFGQTVNSTTTALWLRGSPISLMASSTSIFTYASTTALSVTGSTYLPSLSDGCLSTVSGLVTSTACSSGGGNSKFASSTAIGGLTNNNIYPNSARTVSYGTTTPWFNAVVTNASSTGILQAFSDNSGVNPGWGISMQGGSWNLSTTSNTTGATSTPAVTVASGDPSVSVGTSTPSATRATINATARSGDSLRKMFSLASSTNTTLFSVNGAGHIISGGVNPVLSSCGTSPIAAAYSSDVRGTITIGSGLASACTLTFAAPRSSATFAVFAVTTAGISGAGTSKSTTAVTITFTGTVTGATFDYWIIE